MTWYEGITGAVGGIALIIALLLWTVGGISTSNNTSLIGQMWKPLIVVLTITGVAGLMSTLPGDWIRWLVSWCVDHTHWAGRFTGVTLIIGAAVALAVIVGLDVFSHFTGKIAKIFEKIGLDNGGGIQGRTLTCAAALAVIGSAIPGGVGVVVCGVLGVIAEAGAFLTTLAFGL